MPAVTFMTSFSYGYSGGFLDYMERPEAFQGKLSPIYEEIHDYIDYMRNDEKSDGLFDMTSDLLMDEETKEYRLRELSSKEKGCPKYLGVISFDNDFLKANHWIIGDKLDTEKLKAATRKSINALIDKSEKLDADNCYWTAAIHTNTDNVHIHFQLLEYERLEDRRKTFFRKGQDKLEKEAMEALKSTMVSQVLTQKLTPHLTETVRKVLLPSIAKHTTATEAVVDLIEHLPENKAWQYKRLDKYHEQIDSVVDKIIESDPELAKQFEQYRQELEGASKQFAEIYGKRRDNKLADYAANQMEDFYYRAGNTILKEMESIRENDPEMKAAYLLKKKIRSWGKVLSNDKSREIDKRHAEDSLVHQAVEEGNFQAADELAYFYYRKLKRKVRPKGEDQIPITEHEIELLKKFGLEEEETQNWSIEQAHDVIEQIEENGWRLPSDWSFGNKSKDDELNEGRMETMKVIAEYSDTAAYFLGRLYLKAGNDKEAMQYLSLKILDEKASERDKSYLLNRRIRFDSLTLSDSESTAEEKSKAMFELKHLALDEKNDTAAKSLSFFYLKEKKYDNDSMNTLRRLSDDGCSTASYCLSRIYLDKGYCHLSLKYLDRAVEQGDKYASNAYIKLANQIGQKQKAKSFVLKKTLGGGISRAVHRYSVITSECARAIKRVLAESEQHLAQLQREFDYQQQQIEAHNEYIYG